MGTRGVIARQIKSDEIKNVRFEGVYHHWDSYPTALGKTLYDLYNGHFNKDITKFLQVLIDEHPAGWSTINNADFNLPAGFIDYGDKYEKKPDGTNDYDKPIPHGAVCYCHGVRHEGGWKVDEKNASGSGCEWAYVFDAERATMRVMSSHTRAGKKMKGAFGCGDDDAVWKTVDIVYLNNAEPDWKKIEGLDK